MRNFFHWGFALILWVICGAGCTNHEAHATKPNPPKAGVQGEKKQKIVKSKAEWRVALTDLQFYVLREKAPNVLLRGRTGTKSGRAPTIVRDVGPRYSPARPISNPGPAGPASSRLMMRTQWKLKRIAAWAFFAKRFCAIVAAGIWDMCLTTALSPQVCVIV